MWVRLNENGMAEQIAVGNVHLPGAIEVTDDDYNLARGGCLYDSTLGRFVPKKHFTLGNIPLPAKAIIEDVVYELTETAPRFEFDVPGSYTVVVDAGPVYHKEEFTLAYTT